MRYKPVHLVLIASALALAYMTRFDPADSAQRAVKAPEFTHSEPQEWINSPPLKLSALAGQVVLLDVWTFDCWNCYRSFPWLRSVEKKYSRQPLTVVGVHTPEFAHERVRASIVAKAKQYMLDHAIMIDNDYSYWRALGNRYWPAFYLIDKQGRIRGRYVGETHIGDQRAMEIEALISELLAEDLPNS